MGYYGAGQFGKGYYTGPQGSFFSGFGNFLGRAISRVAPAAALLPGPVGAVGKALTVIGEHPVTAAVAGATVAAGTTALIGRAGAQPGAGVVPTMKGASGAQPGGPLIGLHLQPHFHISHARGPRYGQMVKGRRRRMNVCNPRALRRAVRRFKGFEHIARQVINFTHAKKVKKGYAKRPRARRAVA